MPAIGYVYNFKYRFIYQFIKAGKSMLGYSKYFSFNKKLVR